MHFVKMQKSKKNPHGRKWMFFCENWPACGASMGGTWEPPHYIKTDDHEGILKHQEIANATQQHYCAKCYAGIVAKRPEGAKEGWRPEDYVRPPGKRADVERKIQEAQRQIFKHSLIARVG